MQAPGEPSVAERATHETTHLPYRSWCRHCVEGRAENPPHQHSENVDLEVPELIMDYAFARHHDEQDLVTLLVIKDRQSRIIMARTLAHKGRDMGDRINFVEKCVRRLGHRGKLVIKTDGQNDIKDLREAAMSRLAQTCIPINPPAGDIRRMGPSTMA